MEKLVIKSVNISEKTGLIKLPVTSVELDDNGIKGDAHAGKWHRQVSILSTQSIERFSGKLNRTVKYGEFAENITLEGFNVLEANTFDRIISGDVVLEVTQIGKKCHGSNCAIFKESGDCVMPKEGIFCRVIQGGHLSSGDIMKYIPRVINVHVITLSDRASAGIYEDKSGPYLKDLIKSFFLESRRLVSINYSLIADDPGQLKKLVSESISSGMDLIFTTGGTGIGPRDIAPDVIWKLLDKEITGIMELVRVKYGMQNPNALISRSVAGVSGQTLIYTLPGSPKSLKEYTDEIFKTLEHSFRMIHNIDNH